MMRRKGRDVVESLELGTPIQFSQNVPIRKFTSVKIFKYLILIVLGILLHSMYKKIMQVHSGTPGVEEVDKRLKDVEEKLMQDKLAVDKVKQDQSDNEVVKPKLRKITDEVFEEAKRKQREKDKMEELKEQLKSELKEEHRKELSKNDELLKSINQKLKEQEHKLDEKMKEEAVEAKFEPVDEQEKRDLKAEIAIENDIAKILETVNEKHKDDVTVSGETGSDVEEPVVDMDKQPIFNQPRVVNSVPKKTFVDKTSKISERFNPENVPYKGHHSHEVPAMVTAASQKTMVHVMQLIESIQKFFPEQLIYVFDLDLLEPQRRKLASACNVRLRGFWANLFPPFVQNLTSFHWRPLVMQTALAEFGDIVWINPNVRITSSKLKQIIHETEASGVMLIGQAVAHTTYAVTNPKMYKYIPTTKNKLYKSPHIEMMALVIHNTDNVHENFMKILTACAIEQKCLSPPDSRWECDFDFSGKSYANCHRFDESAINIILKNMFDFDESKFSRGNSFFQPYDSHVKSTMKICRNQR